MNETLEIIIDQHSSERNFLKNQNLKIITLFSLGICFFLNVSAQSLTHPTIWVSVSDKAEIINKISTVAWATSLNTQLHTRVDATKNSHKSNPATLLNTMPVIGNSSARDANNDKVTMAVESATLYYLTGDEDYAQLSADILSYYIEAISKMDSLKVNIYDDVWYEARNDYSKLAMTYDFIHPFIKKNGGIRVYDKSTGTRKEFNNDNAQTSMKFMAIMTLNNCAALHSNHSLLSGRGALFPILMIEDDVTREKFLDHFLNNPRKTRYDPFYWTLNHFSVDNIWPESFDYSVFPSIAALEEMEVLDRAKPELNIVMDNLRILEGIFSFENQIYPSKIASMNYGDSDRQNTVPDQLYTRALAIAKRKGLTELAQKIGEALKNKYVSKVYAPTLTTERLEWNSLLQLLWDKDFSTYSAKPIAYETVFPVTHAGIVVQRNINGANEKDNGMMAYTGGANFVHCHLQGIDMELYGAGYVLGPVGGLLADRSADIFMTYYRIYAGHNTVIVNGTSKGTPGGWGTSGVHYQNTVKLEASEPQVYKTPLSPNFSFTTQILNDSVNNCLQQRTLSIIRTSSTTGYYFDMFRSKSLGENKFHDYIYHNLGEELTINNQNNSAVTLTTSTKYSTYTLVNGYKFPGWHYFESVKSSTETPVEIKARFKMNTPTPVYTYMSIPSGTNREYSSVITPPPLHGEGYNQYNNKKTPAIAIRKNGEAWDKPFIATYEMTTSTQPTVQSVSEIKNGVKTVGAKVVSLVNGVTITDWVINQESETEAIVIPSEGISFAGRFAIVRFQQDKDTAFTTLYIGDGDSLSYGDLTLKADANRKGLKIQGGKPYFGRQLLFKNINNNDVIPKGSNLSIEAIVGEEYKEVTLWGNDTINLGTKTVAPFVWSGHPLISNMQNDAYTFTLIAKDAQGNLENVKIRIETPGQKPYPNSEVPHPVPGKIEFENYDSGGQNLAYFDKSVQNPPLYSYRGSDNVDLGRNGTVIADTESGEWLEYTVDVKQAGIYSLSIRHLTSVAPNLTAFSVSLPNEELSLLSNCKTTYTGKSTYYVDVIAEFSLKQGKQVLRFSLLNSGIELDYMQLTLKQPSGINDAKLEQSWVKVYPNPAKETFTIDLNGIDKADVVICNMAGQLIFRQLVDKDKISISKGPEYNSGIYLIKVMTENQKIYYEKLIIQ